jgi:flagellin
MISINTNYGGLFASKAASQSQRMLDTAMERLSTGKRINYASDDAAGQAIAVRLQAEIEGIAMASRNVADAQSLMDTADGALGETHNILLRMRELAVQASTGTLNSDDNAALDAEFQQLEAEIDRIASNTKWAGTDLFNGAAKVFHVGTKASDTLSHTIARMGANNLGVDSFGADNTAGGTDNIDADLLTATKARGMITAVDNAIKLVSTERGKLGALSNRLSSTISNLDQVRVNLSASQGRIQDADFAAETSNLAKGQILQQAATAMLAQANASKQTVLALVQILYLR